MFVTITVHIRVEIGLVEANLVRSWTEYVAKSSSVLQTFFGFRLFSLSVEPTITRHANRPALSAGGGEDVTRPIWTITTGNITVAEPKDVLIGAALGLLLGAFVAYMFTKEFHGTVMFCMASFDLLDNMFAIRRALFSGVVIVALGLLTPQTKFWGELEFGSISSLSPASTLDNIWPTTGLLGFELTSAGSAFLMGFSKIVAISFTVARGYCGGFISPFFAVGAAFGCCLRFLIPGLNIQVACLCMTAGINVATTRTSLATSLILCYLAGEPNAISVILTSSLVSLFATTYMVRMRWMETYMSPETL
eukprot:scaffold37987_cov59-Attheya_sp.AAC.1